MIHHSGLESSGSVLYTTPVISWHCTLILGLRAAVKPWKPFHETRNTDFLHGCCKKWVLQFGERCIRGFYAPHTVWVCRAYHWAFVASRHFNFTIIALWAGLDRADISTDLWKKWHPLTALCLKITEVKSLRHTPEPYGNVLFGNIGYCHSCGW